MKKWVWVVAALCAVCCVSFAGLNDGLVAYYPFQGNAQDVSGNELHGTVDGATLTTGVNGQGYHFESYQDIRVGDDPLLNFGSSEFSICVWVNTTASPRMRLVTQGALPEKATDAMHVAFAAYHNIDYLLTWNCRHIDNAAKKPLIRELCARMGWASPEICTPLELMED